MRARRCCKHAQHQNKECEQDVRAKSSQPCSRSCCIISPAAHSSTSTLHTRIPARPTKHLLPCVKTKQPAAPMRKGKGTHGPLLHTSRTKAKSCKGMPAKAMQHHTPPHTQAHSMQGNSSMPAHGKQHTLQMRPTRAYACPLPPSSCCCCYCRQPDTGPACAGCAGPVNCGAPCAPAADSAGAAGSPAWAGSMPGGHMGPHITPPPHMPAPHMGT